MTNNGIHGLLIVITRTHTYKGDDGDEFVTYWDGEPNDSGKLHEDFNDACDFLLVHGHFDMQNKIQDKIIKLLYPRKIENDWNPVYILIHARKEYRKRIFKESNNVHVQGYSSRGAGLAPQDLLKKIKEIKDDTSQIDWKGQICDKIREKLKGFRYKQHLLNQICELLLRLRFNMEVFAGNLNKTIQKEASKDIEEVKKKIRDILDKPPLKPQLVILYDNMTSKQRLLSFFSAGLDKTSEEYALLKAGNFWSDLLSSEFFARWSKEKKLPEIAEDFKLLSESVESIMQCIKYNHGHAVSSK